MSTEPLRAEVERVELLGQCLSRLRQGASLEDAVLERLREAQARVRGAREDGSAWRRLRASQLAPVEYDVLACAVAPEMEPRVGWLFQQLQPGATQPVYPTAALIQELLALQPADGARLSSVLSEDAPLRRLGLLERDEGGPYSPIRPSRGLTPRLLGAPEPPLSLPGALRVPGTARWEELVLPEAKLALLREFLLWLQHRETVVEQWGGRAMGGPVALFSGPSGTGKTFAASVLATTMGWELHRVDLGALVSKYIGETEKNVSKLFDAAHGRDVILLFDEADSLFGRRGEVREARDRYANQEVSHLLARIEQHTGPCILTTNLKGNLDPAFARRFQVVVEFPRPDARAQARLWRGLLPPRAPLSPEVDPEVLGSAVSLSGGGIRNAALHAAYLAAGAGTPIGMRELALAVWRELGKEGRDVSASELGPLRKHLPKELGPC
ncbi:ATP-binding protein [Corallococcus exiguus]|uniref:AAA family ATPase n=1 Tax=Corallococcus exiguus TaxID=83462 RepID=A0A7X4YE83_9BACT|nr:ATP-binding protein [Corallococcus exiguus]NBC43838.1 AAA family ATPase [Corallococcus exiguus]TNV53374.1 AAA family ATPase [Corallococcus exiguus]